MNRVITPKRKTEPLTTLMVVVACSPNMTTTKVTELLINIKALDTTVKSFNMKKSIDTYVQSIASDNKQFILEGGYESVADYIISNADNGTAYNEYFDDSELDESGEPTQEQIDELKEYLNDNYNYLP